MTPPILQVKDLRTQFFTDDGVVQAVDGVSFDLHPGETLGIVGESGCGKSVTALSILRLVQEPGRIQAARSSFRGWTSSACREDEVRDIRGKDIAMIFQDPLSSLNPVLRVGLPDPGGDGSPRRHHQQSRRWREQSSCSSRSASRRRSPGCRTTPTSSAGACDSEP